jgi:hypothetical protein
MRGAMRPRRDWLHLTIGLLLIASLSPARPDAAYRIEKVVKVDGDGGWDYPTVDAAARRLYVTRQTRVMVFDADDLSSVGEIAKTEGVHGVAIAPDLGKGFTSNGRANSVTIFDLKTLGSAPSATEPGSRHVPPARPGPVIRFSSGSSIHPA